MQALVIGAVLLVALLGLLASIWLTARLLRPLGVVAAAVRRFGGGRSAGPGPLGGQDEIAQLATEFNRMADQLERYRQSSLGELLQAQQAAQAAIDGLPDPVVVLDGEAESSGGQRGGHQRVAGRARCAGSMRSRATDPGVHALVDRLSAHVLGGKGAYVPKGFEEALRVATTREGERIFLPRATPIYGRAAASVGRPSSCRTSPGCSGSTS